MYNENVKHDESCATSWAQRIVPNDKNVSVISLPSGAIKTRVCDPVEMIDTTIRFVSERYQEVQKENDNICSVECLEDGIYLTLHPQQLYKRHQALCTNTFQIVLEICFMLSSSMEINLVSPNYIDDIPIDMATAVSPLLCINNTVEHVSHIVFVPTNGSDKLTFVLLTPDKGVEHESINAHVKGSSNMTNIIGLEFTFQNAANANGALNRVRPTTQNVTFVDEVYTIVTPNKLDVFGSGTDNVALVRLNGATQPHVFTYKAMVAQAEPKDDEQRPLKKRRLNPVEKPRIVSPPLEQWSTLFDAFNTSTLDYLAYYNCTAKLLTLLSTKKCNLNHTNAFGDTVFHHAALAQNWKILNILILEYLKQHNKFPTMKNNIGSNFVHVTEEPIPLEKFSDQARQGIQIMINDIESVQFDGKQITLDLKQFNQAIENLYAVGANQNVQFCPSVNTNVDITFCSHKADFVYHQNKFAIVCSFGNVHEQAYPVRVTWCTSLDVKATAAVKIDMNVVRDKWITDTSNANELCIVTVRLTYNNNKKIVEEQAYPITFVNNEQDFTFE